ncbi:hypothetical protein F4778DRAFT_336141 [Xylariomycetidae sp. FL2044]|nr:hypothetical protein F4778DRAFT_336141 [Xylariomycetidae sp. FL2044]
MLSDLLRGVTPSKARIQRPSSLSSVEESGSMSFSPIGQPQARRKATRALNQATSSTGGRRIRESTFSTPSRAQRERVARLPSGAFRDELREVTSERSVDSDGLDQNRVPRELVKERDHSSEAADNVSPRLGNCPFMASIHGRSWASASRFPISPLATVENMPTKEGDPTEKPRQSSASPLPADSSNNRRVTYKPPHVSDATESGLGSLPRDSNRQRIFSESAALLAKDEASDWLCERSNIVGQANPENSGGMVESHVIPPIGHQLPQGDDGTGSNKRLDGSTLTGIGDQTSSRVADPGPAWEEWKQQYRAKRKAKSGVDRHSSNPRSTNMDTNPSKTNRSSSLHDETNHKGAAEVKKSDQQEVGSPDTPNDPEYTRKWEEPATPKDLPTSNATTCSILTSDSLESGQNDSEAHAELLAADELLTAGKNFGFGSIIGNVGNSSTSSYIRNASPLSPSRSMVSIESCGSREVSNEDGHRYELDDTSDDEETIKGHRQSAKQLEFASLDCLCSTDHMDSYRTSKKDHPPRQSPASPPDALSRVDVSSLVVHTGHSMDELAPSSGTMFTAHKSKPLITGTRRRRPRIAHVQTNL